MRMRMCVCVCVCVPEEGLETGNVGERPCWDLRAGNHFLFYISLHSI